MSRHNEDTSQNLSTSVAFTAPAASSILSLFLGDIIYHSLVAAPLSFYKLIWFFYMDSLTDKQKKEKKQTYLCI